MTAQKKAKKKAKTKRTTKAKKPTKATANGTVKFKAIPPKDDLTPEEKEELYREVKKIVKKMLNGMSPIEWQDRIRGHFS
jgi:hypothetical protein